ncbi:glutathionylspermidine synthase family protein [Methylosinus sp. Sm6]|uniref:glutathionylspermidine synthase family protein n=1 Tax=Methylosinus sp. Sm6 TaxID=2866948 RepID=UPI001C991EEA|nr:glutathionylspermidine synthase family protein [Methylosinus sp. Sm6]
MRRQGFEPRPDFAEHAARIGFDFAHIDGEPYWDESAAYVFSMREIEEDLERATAELARLCDEVVARIVASEALLAKLRIPRHAWSLIAESFARRDPSLYGRFDFAYDGEGPPKLLEYNADTPTSLYEAAVVQWHWLEQMIARGRLPSDADQFNSLHERLIARWRAIADGAFVHLACMSASIEDRGAIAYLADCAMQAGSPTALLDMGDIGLHGDVFIDREGRRIERLFKLYPWEWMFADSFGSTPAMRSTHFVEPPWKAVASNKGFLALLWDAAPGHPNLLPCFFEEDARAADLRRYARKPLYSREGANITLVDVEPIAQTGGTYGAEGFVRQQLHLLPDFDGRRPALGCWLVDGAPAGMGVREDVALVTSDRSRFLPHLIID